MTNPVPNSISKLIDPLAESVLERCYELARFSEDETCLTRTFCCDAMKDFHRQLSNWFSDAGLNSELDEAANLVGIQTNEKERPLFLLGSHIDTVANAGKFDGTLGVLLGLAAVEYFQQTKTELCFDLGVIAFSEEEGVRFNVPYIGSSSVAGCFDSKCLSMTDTNGVSIKQALDQFCGVDCQPTKSTLDGRTITGFLEPHIEQGPILQHQDSPVGIVTAIAGQTRCGFEFQGRAGHAGTVPLSMRKDALAAAAEFISLVETIGKETTGLFATVGHLQIEPNVSNVIAGHATARLDLRHEDDVVRKTAFDRILQKANELAERRGLKLSIETTLDQAAVAMDKSLNKALAASMQEVSIEALELTSGAGHDAAMMARLAPTCMLFVRCRDGISHHPDEYVELADVKTALTVIIKTLNQISNEQ